MSRTEPASAIIMSIALYGLFVAAERQGQEGEAENDADGAHW